MNLGQIRQEVLNRGFDPTIYGSRITTWINDAQNLIARRCQYYENEGTWEFTTTAGVANYQRPASFARAQYATLADTNQPLVEVGNRAMDVSQAVSGRPMYWSLRNVYVHLYPTPDAVYPVWVKYWSLPPALVSDTDVPNLPADWHPMLWIYGTWMCYEADDDAQMGAYWQQRFEKTLAEFEADAKFQSTDYPSQIESMWGGDDRGLRSGNQWALYWGY